MIHHLEAELLQILREGSSFLRDVSMQLQQVRRLILCHFIKHCSHLLLCELNGTGDFFMNGLLNGVTLAVDELWCCVQERGRFVQMIFSGQIRGPDPWRTIRPAIVTGREVDHCKYR